MFPTFANPEWLWCLLLALPLAGLRVWSHWRARDGANGLVSPRLTRELVVGARQWTRWVTFSLQLIALSLVVVALARPQWGFEITEEESESRNVIIAIDTSRSMLANDLSPDRMTRAKLAAQDIVKALPDDRIGLIAFAGKPFLQAPLTLDHDAVIESIDQFDTELIPRGGSNLTEAAKLAVEIFDKAGSQESALILFSDGEALEGRDELESIMDDAKKVGLMVIAIGVGTAGGSIIPEPDDTGRPQPGAFVKDESGNVVRSRLDPAALQELSGAIGGGVYLDLASTSSIMKAVPEALRRIETSRGASESRRRPIDRFIWPLLGAMLLFVTAWLLPGTSRLLRRLFERNQAPAPVGNDAPLVASVQRNARKAKAAGHTAAIVLAAWGILPPSPADAGIGEVESPAFETYQKKNYQAAIESYRAEIERAESSKQRAWLNLGLGAAAYKAGDLALAKEAFSRTLTEADEQISRRAHYNLGNALFRQGQQLLEQNAHPKNPSIAKDDTTKKAIADQWQAALEHYQSALALNPGDEDAQFNSRVVGQRLQLLDQPPPPEEEEEEQEQDQQQQSQDQSQPQPQDGQPDQPPPGDQPPDPQQPKPEPEPGDNQSPPQNPDSPPDPGEEPAKPEPGNQPPPPPEPETPDGELEGTPPPPTEGEPTEMQPQEGQVNPETGFSPEEARQMLRALSDEDSDVRPPIRLPMSAEKYKNW